MDRDHALNGLRKTILGEGPGPFFHTPDDLVDAVRALSTPPTSERAEVVAWPGVAAEDRGYLTRTDMDETWEAMAAIAEGAEDDLVEVEAAMLRMIIRSARSVPAPAQQVEPVACNGCGATEDDQRCRGCLHDFGTPESAWVRKHVERSR